MSAVGAEAIAGLHGGTTLAAELGRVCPFSRLRGSSFHRISHLHLHVAHSHLHWIVGHFHVAHFHRLHGLHRLHRLHGAARHSYPRPHLHRLGAPQIGRLGHYPKLTSLQLQMVNALGGRQFNDDALTRPKKFGWSSPRTRRELAARLLLLPRAAGGNGDRRLFAQVI